MDITYGRSANNQYGSAEKLHVDAGRIAHSRNDVSQPFSFISRDHVLFTQPFQQRNEASAGSIHRKTRWLMLEYSVKSEQKKFKKSGGVWLMITDVVDDKTPCRDGRCAISASSSKPAIESSRKRCTGYRRTTGLFERPRWRVWHASHCLYSSPEGRRVLQ